MLDNIGIICETALSPITTRRLITRKRVRISNIRLIAFARRVSYAAVEDDSQPDGLETYDSGSIPTLCQEIREQILSVVSQVGGHLASNLGVVELTVALHYLLDTPKDKIVWDTSNQAYTHKLLTGRREQFHTLRQYGGLSGFCKREESIYDTFNAGHAGHRRLGSIRDGRSPRAVQTDRIKSPVWWAMAP